MNAPGETIPAKASKSFDFMGCLRHRAVIILVLGAALAVCIAPLAALQGKAYYETEGKILLAREMPQITGRGDEFNIANYFHDYARTQVERIRSLQTIEAALERLPEPVRRVYVPKPGTEKVAALALEKQVAVAQIPNTHVIQVKLTAKQAAGMAEVVNAIMAAYLERLHAEEENKEQRRIEYLSQERDTLLASIKAQTAEVREIVKSTKVSPDQDQNDIYVRRVINLQDAYIRAQAERMVAESNWNQTQDMGQKLRNVSNKALVDEMVVGDQALWRTASWTYEKLQELRASIDGVTRENPDRQYVEKRMEAMQQYEEKQRHDVQERAERIIDEKREYDINQRLLTAEKEYRVRQNTEEDLRRQLDEALAKLEQNSQNSLRGKALLANIENEKKKYFEIEGRIRDLVVNAKAPLRVSVESYAVQPETPAGNNRSKIVMLSVFACFGAIAFLVFLYDFTDDRIRSPRNVSDYLGRPPTWPISDYRPAVGDGAARFPRVLLDDPGSTVAKSLRSLAVRLDKERQEHGARVTTLSAVNPGSGATSISLNAAHAMKHFCERVLLVEADNIRPGLGRLLAAETAAPPDLAAVLSGSVSIESCVRRDSLRDIDCLLLGEGRWNEELYRQLPVFLDRLRQEYDYIIINCAPILDTDLTEMLLVRSDVAVLVVQGDRTKYGEFARTAELMLRLEVPALASVLNWGGPKPVTRFDKVLVRLPWPWVRRMAAWLSKASKSSTFLALCLVGGLLLTANAANEIAPPAPPAMQEATHRPLPAILPAPPPGSGGVLAVVPPPLPAPTPATDPVPAPDTVVPESPQREPDVPAMRVWDRAGRGEPARRQSAGVARDPVAPVSSALFRPAASQGRSRSAPLQFSKISAIR